MDSVEREIRLWQLASSLMKGEMTEQERQEYDTLRLEQATEEDAALLALATILV
jgi:hypothetical protein